MRCTGEVVEWRGGDGGLGGGGLRGGREQKGVCACLIHFWNKKVESEKEMDVALFDKKEIEDGAMEGQ